MILSADLGGTTIKIGLVRDGSVVARTHLEACADRPMTERLEAVAKAWEKLLAETGHHLHECAGVALSLPFLVEPNRPRVLGEFGKFPGATEIDFGTWCRDRLGLGVVLENDLRMALLGESSAGSARGKNEVVMLALGTGIGCAVLSGGRLFRGANNRAATIFGHSTIARELPAGRCGNIGCAEDLASTATLPQLAMARSDYPASALAKAVGAVGAGGINFKSLFELADRGDACSKALLAQSLKTWSIIVLNAVLAYDPEIVVLGGGVLRRGNIILPAIEEHLRVCMPGLPLHVPLVAAELGDDAALVGGEAFFHQSRKLP